MRLTILLLILAAFVPHNHYWDENCSQYVSHVIGIAPQTAADFYAGKNLMRVRECDTLAQCEIVGLADGDVVAFHGVHVAIYQDGVLRDSDPRHDGPGLLQYREGDNWFSGPIEILRVRK